MKQTKADLLIEIGKLTQLVEEIRDRLTRLEAKAPYIRTVPAVQPLALGVVRFEF